MRLKDLIKELQEIDEKYGEEDLHVCVGNCDVSNVTIEPSYYDGSQQIVFTDEKGRPVSGKYKRSGSKVVIDYWKFSELVWADENFQIEYLELDEKRQESCKKHHDEVRQASKNCDYEIELENFTKHIKSRAADIPDNVIKQFFDDNLSPWEEIPDDIPWVGKSYIDRRKEQWNREITIIGSKIIKIIP